MILVHIITKSRAQALEIVDTLLDKKLLFNAMVSRKKVYKKDAFTGELKGTINTLIIGKTRALLFNSINKLLSNTYSSTNQIPNIYCLPIVYMDPKRAEELLEQTLEV